MNKVYLANSREWYENQEQIDTYLNLINSTYGSGIVQSEDLLLKNNLDKIVSSFSSSMHYIDLGPGNGKKTLFLCEAFARAKKLEYYTAVDIQPQFLEITNTIKEKFGSTTLAVEESFENFLDRNFTNRNPSFIYLGATYGNFKQDYIEPKLRKFMQTQDQIYLSSGLFPDNIEEAISKYGASLPMFKSIAKKQCLPEGGEFKVIFSEENSTIEQVYQYQNTMYVLGISKKPTEKAFRSQVSKYFNGEFFIEQSHIGFLGRKK